MHKIRLVILFFAAFLFLGDLYAQDVKIIELLPAQTEGGKPLMQALKERKSSRDFANRQLPLQVLSNLLWAANGINRPRIEHRTAPSAMNMQEIDIYVAKDDGLYLFDAKKNIMVQVGKEDIRELTGKQDFVKDAPVNLIYVADLFRMSKATADSIDQLASADAAFISQNVYLFCASEGLSTVVRGWIDKPVLEKAMKLGDGHKVIFAQSVGYPKK